jgi:hypothetical protein
LIPIDFSFPFRGGGAFRYLVPKWLLFLNLLWGVVFTACVVFLFLTYRYEQSHFLTEGFFVNIVNRISMQQLPRKISKPARHMVSCATIMMQRTRRNVDGIPGTTAGGVQAFASQPPDPHQAALRFYNSSGGIIMLSGSASVGWVAQKTASSF